LKNEKLHEQWKKEETDFLLKGWDFSCLAGRMDGSNPPWDYRHIVKSYLKDSDALLDIGTGGGEVLLTINHPYNNTYATEAYEPNYELCRKKLSPLGITVVRTHTDANFNTDDKIPFEDEKFDFIINRHESFDLSEVNRTLKRGGYFFTQQVGNRNFYELAEILNGKVVLDSPNHAVESYASTLTQLGFQIIMKDEVKLPTKFFDVGAVIFYAKACPWEIPNFSVETHFSKLCEIQKEIDKRGFFQVTGGRFLLASRKL
jgi:SAM-dependent methyltransferase